MPRVKYEIGDIVSGSNLAENFKGQTLTAVGFTRGSDVPLCVLRSHESTSPTHIADIDGEAGTTHHGLVSSCGGWAVRFAAVNGMARGKAADAFGPGPRDADGVWI